MADPDPDCKYRPGYFAPSEKSIKAHVAPYDSESRVYFVGGPCPRCGHTTSDDAIPLTVLLPEAGQAAPPAVAPPPEKEAAPPPAYSRAFLRVCDCDYYHEIEQGKSGQGCGARWALTLTARPPADGRIDTAGAVPPLTLSDQGAVDAAIDGSLTQARSTAEKWRNVLAGLTGLVGTFLVLGGVTEFSKAPNAQAIVAFGLLGLGCAAYGAYRAAEAAIGGPVDYRTRGRGDAAGMKVARIRQAELAAGHLSAAKVLTVVAGLWLALATLYAYGPEKTEPGSQLSLTLRNAQAPVCGVPTKGPRNVVVITTENGQRIAVPMSDVVEMEIVGSC
jgi:hypothetical protein